MGLLPASLRAQLLAMQYNGRRLSWSAAYPDLEDWILSREDGKPAGRMLLALPATAAGTADEGLQAASPSFRVVDIPVRPAFQRQGVAGEALRQAQVWAAEAGCGITLPVARANAGAQRLYQALGFSLAGGDEISFEMHWRAARPQEAD